MLLKRHLAFTNPSSSAQSVTSILTSSLRAAHQAHHLFCKLHLSCAYRSLSVNVAISSDEMNGGTVESRACVAST